MSGECSAGCYFKDLSPEAPGLICDSISYPFTAKVRRQTNGLSKNNKTCLLFCLIFEEKRMMDDSAMAWQTCTNSSTSFVRLAAFLPRIGPDLSLLTCPCHIYYRRNMITYALCCFAMKVFFCVFPIRHLANSEKNKAEIKNLS